MTEIRNSKRHGSGLVYWRILYSDLFRISSFGFRVYKFPKAKKVRNNNLFLIKGGII